MTKQEFKNRIKDDFYPHCVSLRFVNNSADRIVRFSAFVYEWEDDWYLVTAGHSFKVFREDLQFDEFTTCKIDDHLHKSGRIDPANMITIDKVTLFDAFTICYDDENDWAFLKLTENYVSCLKANQIKPFQKYSLPDECDFYWVLGIPFDSVQIDGNVETNVFSLLRGDKLDDDASKEFGANDNFAVARVGNIEDLTDEEHSFESVLGMSGGPVIGFFDEEQLEFSLVGIQSTWRDQSRIIKFCKFAKCLEEIVKTNRS